MLPRLNFIMAALFSVGASIFPTTSFAEVFDQIVNEDPGGSTAIDLSVGDSVVYTGTGSAVSVSGQGNSVNGTGIAITASGGGQAAKAAGGGSVVLVNSEVSTLGNRDGSHGLLATGVGSHISLTGNSTISTESASSAGAAALYGGRIDIDGATISTLGNGAPGVLAENAGSHISVKNASIKTTGYSGYGARVDSGATMSMNNVDVITNNDSLYINGVGSDITASNVNITSAGGRAVYVSSANFNLDGGVLAAYGDAVYLTRLSGSAGASATIKNASLTSQTGFGVNVNAPGASAILENVDIKTSGNYTGGIWMPGQNTVVSANTFSIDTTGDNAVALDNRGGQATLANGTIVTRGNNAHALYASHEYGAAAGITATNVDIETFGAGAVGALSRMTDANVALYQSTIKTHGNAAYGLFASGTKAFLSATDSIVSTTGDNAHGLSMSNRASVSLNNTHISTTGATAGGVWSYSTVAGDFRINVLPITASTIDTQDGVGLLATGANHVFTLEGSQITARQAGVEDKGVFLQTDSITSGSGASATVLETDKVQVNANASIMTGDVLARSGVVDLNLTNSSVLTGALRQENSGRINSLALDDTSIWNVRGDSTLGTLTNSGVIAFTAPGATDHFKTLTVNDYVGGGTLVINTRLEGDDASTDRLIIDGGTATGSTSLRVVKAGGAGALTVDGIQVVQAINGATTEAKAFQLDAGSTGFRGTSNTIAINGYDYSLVRQDAGAAAESWYLTSTYTAPPVTPPVDPTEPTVPPVTPPVDPTEPTVPNTPIFQNVSPESGAYLANQMAATNMFSQGLHDRQGARMAVGSDGQPNNQWWGRAVARRSTGIRMAQGESETRTDSTLMQIGGDLLRQSVGENAAVYMGVMAGYGSANSKTDANAMHEGYARPIQLHASSKTSGYSAGVYATIYADDATRLGAYGDTWLQYGRFSNHISSEIGSVNYRSSSVSGSFEVGYAVKPFASDSVLGHLAVEPHAQVILNHYDANDAELAGTRMRNNTTNSWVSRVGVRVYPKASAGEAEPAIQPFIEANWLRTNATHSVQMGSNSLAAAPSRDALELSVGAKGQLSRNTQLSANVFGQQGSGDQRGYGGTLNLSYRW